MLVYSLIFSFVNITGIFHISVMAALRYSIVCHKLEQIWTWLIILHYQCFPQFYITIMVYNHNHHLFIEFHLINKVVYQLLYIFYVIYFIFSRWIATCIFYGLMGI